MLIPLEQLHAHPGNANVMPERLLAKLQAHIRDGGRYPPLIVRPIAPATNDPSGPPAYQILDGHHRAIALRRLGHAQARCDVWDGIDDARAALLLLTLNRLRGEDDPLRRGSLLRQLAGNLPPDQLARLLPDDQERIERLIALTRPPPAAAIPLDTPRGAALAPPQALTFFLAGDQRVEILRRLHEIDPDRNDALAKAVLVTPRDTN
jgi:ParB-like chromosome segregation protein Spo0J